MIGTLFRIVADNPTLMYPRCCTLSKRSHWPRIATSAKKLKYVPLKGWTLSRTTLITIVRLNPIYNLKSGINRSTRLTLMLIRLMWRVPTLRTLASKLWATMTPIKTTLVMWSLISSPWASQYIFFIMDIIKNLNERPINYKKTLSSHIKRKSESSIKSPNPLILD